MFRSRLGMIAVIFASVVTTTFAEQKDLIRTSVVRTYDVDSGTPLAVLAKDPARAETAAAGALGTCHPTGDYLQVFAGPSRYRGNIYHIDTNVTLVSVDMELNIPVGASTTLHFAIYQQDNISGTWTSVIGSRAIPTTGRGQDFYSSGAMFEPLNAGFNYVMAFGWGADISIGYGRDVLPALTTYPGATPASFNFGDILGRVGTTLSPPFPPTYETIGSNNTSAQSMILCLVPETGACCSPSSKSCSQELENDCLGEVGAHFFGERTLCLDNLCEFGACCTACGICLDDFPAEACSTIGGVDHWKNATCPTDGSSLCPEVTGACCQGDGTCTELCESQCVGASAVYHGDGSNCDVNPCIGACCLPDFPSIQCAELTESACTGLGGSPLGLGTTCDNLPPGNQCGGACCWGIGSLSECRLVDNRVDCSANALPFGIQGYRGDATVCPAVLADCGTLETDYGGCCMPDATCINMPGEDECRLAGGNFGGLGVICGSGFACTNEACCLPDGSCDLMTDTACNNLGGVPQVVSTCQEAGCTKGACCESSEGRCTTMTEAACADAAGSYGGNGSTCDAPALTCDPVLGLGACCVDGSFCLDALTSLECSNRNGTHTLGTTCAILDADIATPDCDERGACCTQTGICLSLTMAECEAPQILGSFTAGKTCTADFCPAGACCHENGCTVTGETYCRRVDGLNGSYKGNGSTCTTNACIPSGACCINGTCLPDTRRIDCEDGGGIYLGDDAPCTADTCTLGTCCDHGNCNNFQIAFECSSSSTGIDFLPGEFCSTDPCERFGACCFDNGVCLESESQTACEFASGTFSRNLTCDQAGCEPNGACCLRDGTCQDSVALSDCEAQAGILSTEKLCDAVVCDEIGACCLRDGTCENDLTRTDCQARRGTSTPDRTCGQIGLCTPVGACCVPGIDVILCNDDLNQGDCEAQGGSYRGDETNCPADGTACGSCCSLTGCADNVMSSECQPTDQQEDFDLGVLCADREAIEEAACIPRGACCPVDGVCKITTSLDCVEIEQGTFAGDGTTCDNPNVCIKGACCNVDLPDNENCLLRTEFDCRANLGQYYQGDDTTCSDQSICNIGSCCPATGIDDCLPNRVASECAIPEDFRTGQATCLLCEGRGACCLGNDVACQVLPESQCLGDSAVYHGNATTCPAPEEDDVCFVGACCDGLSDCTQQRRFDCEIGGGLYGGAGVACNPCPTLLSADPDSCTIDPAQPSRPDGTGVAGITSITLHYSANVFGLDLDDFLIDTTPGNFAPPTGATLTINGPDVIFEFDAPVPAREWTCITDLFYGGMVCVASLPGDVDASRVTSAAPDGDVDTLIANLVTPNLPLARCDINRSGACTPLDLMREIDLLIGAQEYIEWQGRNIPSCPTAP